MTDPLPNDGGRARTLVPVVTSMTLVPIGLAVIIVVTALSMKTWIDSQFESMSTQIRELQFQMKTYESAMITRSSDRWTGTQMRLFISELSRLNPTLQLPNLKDLQPTEVK